MLVRVEETKLVSRCRGRAQETNFAKDISRRTRTSHVGTQGSEVASVLDGYKHLGSSQKRQWKIPIMPHQRIRGYGSLLVAFSRHIH
ncbi:hypothetical protein SCLCIDRAFT_953148 [Scleroderma citrinum Foug A]|uniref:Uncharacterized protein n=1 Tax=Scleroderma citrinum Foug A TaxID=1036808 RepID=A0A0C3A434_9AGAM|nr:hypothetical protein SCLCIDRAFT_953148 [Scleroderma citrinum Foug A]